MTTTLKTQAPESNVATPVQERRVSVPRHEVYSTEQTYEIRLYMPGVSQEGLSVNLEESLLTVKGTAEPIDVAGYKQLYHEFSLNDYEAAFRIPLNVNRDSVQAALDRGILKLTLPIREKERKAIKVNVG